jgi:DNA-binding NarL/FixJ family response regulator
MMRDGLRSLLVGDPDIKIIGEASDGRAALELVGRLLPDVVRMDIGMPDLNGIEATRRIRAEYPGVNVVALSTHADKRYVHYMLKAGASAYVLKIAAFNELVQAVRVASFGRTYLSPQIAGAVIARSMQDHAGAEESVYSALGSRERKVLELVADGMASTAIAAEMHISIKTVESHRRNLAYKLGLHGTPEATKSALCESLTSLDR